MKQELLKETKEEYMKRASFIKSSFMVNKSIAMCIVNKKVTNVDLAEIAEELVEDATDAKDGCPTSAIEDVEEAVTDAKDSCPTSAIEDVEEAA